MPGTTLLAALRDKWLRTVRHYSMLRMKNAATQLLHNLTALRFASLCIAVAHGRSSLRCQAAISVASIIIIFFAMAHRRAGIRSNHPLVLARSSFVAHAVRVVMGPNSIAAIIAPTACCLQTIITYVVRLFHHIGTTSMDHRPRIQKVLEDAHL